MVTSTAVLLTLRGIGTSAGQPPWLILPMASRISNPYVRATKAQVKKSRMYSLCLGAAVGDLPFERRPLFTKGPTIKVVKPKMITTASAAPPAPSWLLSSMSYDISAMPKVEQIMVSRQNARNATLVAIAHLFSRDFDVGVLGDCFRQASTGDVLFEDM